jgi:hypothetical protein
MVSRNIGATVLAAILAVSAGGAMLTDFPGLAVHSALFGTTFSDINWIATSAIKPSATVVDVMRFTAGEQVVLLDNDPPGGVGLKAGRSGTVLCCDSNDGSGDILISWDLWTDGKAGTSACFNGLNALYPANSAIWVNPKLVHIGHHFKQCGTIRRGLEGCVNFETDDGQYYNVVASGTLYDALIAGDRVFHFDDRVQIQGLLNLTPPAPGVTRICPQFDGDIFHPILSACPGGPGLPGPFTINLGGSPLQLVPDPNSPGPGYTYDGCVSVTLDLNFRGQLSVKITPAPGVNGTWSGTVTPDIVGPGAVTVQICVHVEHLDVNTLPAGNNVQVATTTLSAVPIM